MFVISDNTDTMMGLRLSGVEGVVVHDRDNAIKELEKAINDSEIGIVLMTTIVISYFPDVVYEMKSKIKKPLIVEIPDRHGSLKLGETIDKYISEAIGIKI
jgi:Archaeal/vacuolar-type H+-ATPase subunit F